MTAKASPIIRIIVNLSEALSRICYIISYLSVTVNSVKIDKLMNKKSQSIDGFVLRRPSNASGEPERKRVFIDTVDTDNQVKSKKNISDQNPKKSATKKETSLEDEALILDNAINESLEQLPNEDDSSAKKHGKSSRFKHHEKKSKNQKKLGKPKSRKRKIIKWSAIAILALILIVTGYFVVKALLAGGKVFQGNVLDALTSKTKLQEDSNGRTNILIFGTSGYEMSQDAWDGAFLTDSIMVLSVNQEKNDAYMVSLPRDLYIKHTCKALGTSAGKLNESYYCGYTDNKNDEKAGAAELEKAAEAVLGLDIQYYIHADWTALIQAVDAVGGVDVTIDSSDSRGVYDVATKVKYPNGEAHLNGERALALARSRNSHGGYGLGAGNFDREMYQQKILAALQKKALSAGTLTNLSAVNALIDALGDNLRTDFKTSEIQTIVDLTKNIKTENIVSLPLVSRPDDEPDLLKTDNVGGASVVVPVAGTYNYTDIQKYIKSNLTSDPVTKEAAIIDVLNGSGVAGFAKTKANELEEAGYTIGEVTNAPQNITDKVVIYQIDSSKSGTASALENKFGVKVETGSLSGYTPNDKTAFVIVFGSED